MTPPLPATHSNRPGDILYIAAWFGLVTGLVEGAGFLIFQNLGWLSWYTSLLYGVSVEIIWIAALVNLLLFGTIGLVLAVVARFGPKLPWAVLCALLFAFLAYVSWKVPAVWLRRLSLFDFLLCGVIVALVVVARLYPQLPWRRLGVWLCAFLTCVDWLSLTGRLYGPAVVILAAGLAVMFTRWFHERETQTVHFWRRSLPWVAALTLLALGGIEGGIWWREQRALAQLPAAPPGSPNVLVIVIDTLRADHLSSYGYARLTSPNLDRIAQQGVLFENAYSASSWTPPSHASMLTGRYAYEHGVEWNRVLDGRYPTLAEALRARGYRTAAFSANRAFFCRRMGFGRGFIRFEDYFHNVSDMLLRTFYGRTLQPHMVGFRYLGFDPQKRAVHVSSAVLRWITRDQKVPFFAFLNYLDTHSPYLPPQPYRSKFSKGKRPSGILTDHRPDNYRNITPEQLQGEIDAYDGAITYMDESIGGLLAELQKRGLGEDTLVVVTSDHGESFGEHGFFLHRNTLYRQEIHVPLIFWWPGHVPGSKRVTQPVTNAALPATIMDLIGERDQQLFPHASLAQLWQPQGGRLDWPYPLAEIAQQPFENLRAIPVFHGAMKSLVSPPWHYIMHEKFGPELYDWSNDPHEVHNLVQKRETQEIILQFKSRLPQFSTAP